MPSPVRLAAAFLVGALAACGPSGPLGPNLHFTVASKLGQDGTCSQPDLAVPSLGTSVRMRLTVRVHDAMNHTASVCDSLVDGIANLPTLAFPVPAGDQIDYFAESFVNTGGAWQRTASGALLDVDPKTNPPPDLRLLAAEGSRCLPPAADSSTRRKLGQPRAFHTATALPNGQVLLVGGLIPSMTAGSEGPLDANNELYATDSIEVYDPATHTFFTPGGDLAMARRAFGTAVLVDSSGGKYTVAVVGGLSSMNAGDVVATVKSFLLGQGDRVDPKLPIVPAPAELIVYDPVAKAISHMPAPSTLHSTALEAVSPVTMGGMNVGLVAAGGVTCDQTMPSCINGGIDALTGVASVQSAKLMSSRVAAGAVPLTDSLVYVVGGGSTMSKPFVRTLVQGGAPEPSDTGTASVLSSLLFPTLATATVNPSSPGFVVAGGLDGSMPGALDPPAIGPKLVVESSGNPTATDVNLHGWQINCGPNDDHYRPVAYAAASLLPSGDRVLITGGAPRYKSCTGSDCEMGDANPACATHQIAMVNLSDDSVAPSPASLPSPSPDPAQGAEVLQIARFGHTQTALPDGSILIAGGLTRRMSDGMGATFAASDVELYNPARQVAALDPTGLDVDDPVAADLKTLQLVRGAGEQAHVAGVSAPRISCGGPM